MSLRLIFITLLISAIAFAGPAKYTYDDGENHISDKNMHPDFHNLNVENQMFAKMSMPKVNGDELKTEYWINNAKAFVEEQVKKTPNTNKAKNIIMFLGDGMSHPSIAAARIYMGGEERKLAFEEFPFTASSMTYCVDKQVSDSACTATAYLNGVKANDATIGLNAKATLSNCFDGGDKSKWTESIASWAMTAGKDAGFVTTTRVTHASPTGVYGHIADRDWENDVEVMKNNCTADQVDDIAEQLVYGDIGKKLKVIMGGGSKHFIDREYYEHNIRGARSDGKHLINEWKDMNPARVYVNNRNQLRDLDHTKVVQVLGMFSGEHNPYNLDVIRDKLQDEKPTLTEMTLKAIDILSQNPEGYFLFVEGGRIDHGHHGTEAKYAIDETAEFSKAIEEAMKKINTNDTLVVVTADHGHVMSLAGYAPRGNDIFGMAGNGDDGIPYMTLSYANGLGFYNHWKEGGGRVDPTTINREANNFKFPATLPLDSERHGGEDVGIWAVGPWAHLFGGSMEQHIIPHIMAYASCIGHGLKMCK